MKRNDRLFTAANWIIGLAVIAAVIAAQWKHEAVPILVVLLILALMLAKARLVILDFIGLRDMRPRLAAALLAWILVFAGAGAAKTVLPLLS